MAYRLGLDVGTNSIGWATIELNQQEQPVRILNMGSRIFSDGREPKTQTSLAVGRRMARQARRRRDRFLQRKKVVLNRLVKMGLFPADKSFRQKLKGLDVLALRASAVRRVLEPYEVGRVLFHINQRRGFKSGRKEASAEDAKNKISERIAHLNDELKREGAESYGDYLYKRSLKGLSTRATVENGFYPVRALVEEEYDKIVEKQEASLSSISHKDWELLRGAIFFQRPLRPVERGTCAVYRDKVRAFRYSPSFEQYRLLSEIWNLRYRGKDFAEHELTTRQKEQLFQEMKEKKELPFEKIRKLLMIDPESTFSIEERLKIKGCPTAWFFSKKDILGKAWASLSLEQKDILASVVFEAESSDEIRKRLTEFGFDSTVVHLAKDIEKLPPHSEVTCAFSEDLMRAVVKLSLNDRREPIKILNDIRGNEVPAHRAHVSELEYYGKAIPESVMQLPKHICENPDINISTDERSYGRIANPTVHIGLNQIRKLVNEIVKRNGVPEAIHIEFARDLKLSKNRKDELARQNKKNRELNEKARAFIEEQGQVVNYANIERAKLWFEMENSLPRTCVYTGLPISQAMVFSEKVEVDHILPFSRTLDDSFSNKVLVMAEANRQKKNYTPAEKFGADKNIYSGILSRAAEFKQGKRWRFAEGAIREFESNDNWLARQLTDTSYLAKVSRKYLGTLIDDSKVVCVPGRLTALLRAKWGLGLVIGETGEKNRNDHRHHAVDAVVVGLTDRSMLQKVSRAAEHQRSKLKIDPPWNDFFLDVKNAVQEIVVSHKMDHGKNGAMLEETCFGVVKALGSYEIANKFKLVTSKRREDVSKFENIRDTALREHASRSGIDSLQKKILKLRVYDTASEDIEEFGTFESSLAIVRHGEDATHVKFYKKGDIHHVGIWRMPGTGELRFICVKVFDLKSRSYNEFRPHPAAKLLMKVCKRDTVAIEDDGQRKLYTLGSIKAANKQVLLVPLMQSKRPDTEKAILKVFNHLQRLKFRKVYVSPMGRVFDNGPVL